MIRQTYCNTIIAIGGPPHSGKSIFLSELYRQLLARSSRVFRQGVCLDGEGMWSNESDPSLVQSIRRKGHFSKEFVTKTLSTIDALGRNPHFSIVLLDLGGKLTAENAEILQRTHFLVLLSSLVSAIPQWQAFAAAAGCETLAILESQLCHRPDKTLDITVRSQLNSELIPLSGVLYNLDRDSNTVTYQWAIEQLADYLSTRFCTAS